MDSDLHNQQQIVNNSPGLTRYQSAPSSYFSNLINSGIYGDDDNNIDQFFNPRVSVSNTVTVTAAAGSGGCVGDSTAQQILNQIGGFQPQFMDSVKQEQEAIYTDSHQQQMIFSNQFQSQSQSQSDHNNNQTVSNCSSIVNDSVNLPTNLLRQSSSPAGFFSQLEIDNGYNKMRSIDDYRGGRGNVSNSLLTSTKRLKNEMGFSSGSLASSGVLPRINEGKIMDMKSGGNDGGFGSHSWDDSDLLADSFLKDFGESDQNKLSNLNSSENQHNDVGRIRAPITLIHHLSLPTSTAELDKLLQFQDSVPLRSRAKRGCATHPRSIAERVRRTRISERMRKLQELVPNMDKQTNTADMLDLAVDYIKELQKEAESLSDHHAKCSCPHKQKL